MDADTKAIKGIWIEYASSLNAGDVSRWVSLWTEDGVQMPPGEPPVIGKDRIRKRIQGILDEVRFNMRIEPREVKVAGDWAFSRGVYSADVTPRKEGAAAHIDGKFMTIHQRRPDGKWKIHRDIFNSNVKAN